MKAKAIHVVYADWCPHCVPTTVEPMKKAAKELGVPYHGYNIDTSDEAVADEVVRKYGDWSEDYIIPQVFLEFEDGTFKHVLTGYPEGVVFTRRAVENFLSSDLYLSLKNR
jgi:glutaredoxin